MNKTVEICCINNGVTKDYPAGVSLQEIYADMQINMPNGLLLPK